MANQKNVLYKPYNHHPSHKPAEGVFLNLRVNVDTAWPSNHSKGGLEYPSTMTSIKLIPAKINPRRSKRLFRSGPFFSRDRTSSPAGVPRAANLQWKFIIVADSAKSASDEIEIFLRRLKSRKHDIRGRYLQEQIAATRKPINQQAEATWTSVCKLYHDVIIRNTRGTMKLLSHVRCSLARQWFYRSKWESLLSKSEAG